MPASLCTRTQMTLANSVVRNVSIAVIFMRACPSFAVAARTLSDAVKYHNMFSAPRPRSPLHDKKSFASFLQKRRRFFLERKKQRTFLL
jgi:hypothetical protein